MSKDLENIIEQAKSEAEIANIINFLKKHSKIIIGVIVGVLILSAVIITNSQINKNRKIEYSSKLHQAFVYLDGDQEGKAINLLKEIYQSKKSPYPIKSLALLKHAALLVKAGEDKLAADIYDSLNSCKKCDKYVQDLGGFLYSTLVISNKDLISDKEEVEKKVSEILEDTKSYSYNIREQRAIFYLQNNDLEKSYQDYDMIAGSPEAPKYLRERANNQKINIISKGYQPSKEKSGDA